MELTNEKNMNNKEENIMIKIDEKEITEMVKSFPVGGFHDEIQDDFDDDAISLLTGYRAEEMLLTLKSMYEWTKNELKNYFTFEEAWCVFRAFGTSSADTITERPKDMLNMQIEDTFIYEPHDELSQVGIKTVHEKIKALTEYQCYVVIMLCFEYKNNADLLSTHEEFKKTFLIES